MTKMKIELITCDSNDRHKFCAKESHYVRDLFSVKNGLKRKVFVDVDPQKGRENKGPVCAS